MGMLEKLISTLSPECCVLCSSEGSLLCTSCHSTCVAQRVPACFWCNALTSKGQSCPRCRAKTYLSGATIPFRLEESIATLIYQLKYDGHGSVARLFGRLLAESELPFEPEIVSFVPSTGESMRSRGYNQAQLLAREFARHRRLPMQPLLLREQHIDQIGLGRASRLQSVQGAFWAIPGRSEGRRVLLLDDVVTTGATLNECARVLKSAGAGKIWGLAIAKK